MINYRGQKHNGLIGMWVESLGQLNTDIYGLSSATAVYVSPQFHVQYPAMYARHPVWSFLTMERRTVSIEYGFARATCEYAGFEGTPEEVEEWSSGVSEEPIQTHPNFVEFAGKPSAPLNGSRWVDEEGAKTANDEKGIFDKFWSNPPNKWSGITSYLVPVKVRRLTKISSNPAYINSVGDLVDNMLVTAVTSIRRGKVYQNTIEYRGAGPRGWNTEIYGS